uniref:Uncharacterized protein n=1 Tax=Glossina palpalis gambiensis TaxID=67801 RepID=A0A1B0B9D1_9MUSC
MPPFFIEWNFISYVMDFILKTTTKIKDSIYDASKLNNEKKKGRPALSYTTEISWLLISPHFGRNNSYLRLKITAAAAAAAAAVAAASVAAAAGAVIATATSAIIATIRNSNKRPNIQSLHGIVIYAAVQCT